jgi:TRAP transporter TAXI family solute receptor
MKKFVVLLLLCVIVVGTAAASPQTQGDSAPRAQTVYLKFPTASTSGAVYLVGAALATLWNEKIPGLQVTAEASNGGVQNLGFIASKDAQLGVAVTSIITEQKRGEKDFVGHAYDGVRILTALYSNYNQVVVSGSSNIRTLSDIKGKRFAPGAPGGTTVGETQLHLEMAGLKYPDDFSAQFVAATEAVDLIRNRQIDGTWIQAGLPTSGVSDISTAGGRLVSMDEELIKNITAKYPWYNRAVIPAGTYAGQTQDVITTSITITVVVDQSVPDDIVYQMTKVMYENIDTLKLAHSALKETTLEGAVQNLANLPLHPGAAKYYREKGVLK